jgi:hypothetical protein
VYAIGILGDEAAKAFDRKNELARGAELIDKYGISQMDAMAVMQAHSLDLDFFLTWDDSLIKKAAKVNWLKPKVITPSDFLIAKG